MLEARKSSDVGAASAPLRQRGEKQRRKEELDIAEAEGEPLVF